MKQKLCLIQGATLRPTLTGIQKEESRIRETLNLSDDADSTNTNTNTGYRSHFYLFFFLFFFFGNDFFFGGGCTFQQFWRKKLMHFFLKIVSSKANISNTFFDQKSSLHLEMFFLFNFYLFLFFLGGVQNRTFEPSQENQAHLPFKLCHCKPILGIHSLTTGLPDSPKWVFWYGTDRHTHTRTSQLYEWIGLGADSVKIAETAGSDHI